MKAKITIVGGGISGLATALALKRIGFETSIYEKKAEISTAGAGVVLGSNALKALDYLGVLSEVQQSAVSSNYCMLYDNHGKTITTIHSEKAEFPIYTFIHRKDLISILLNALSKKQIFYKKKLVFFTSEDEKSQLFFEDGTLVKTDYLLACDGIHSAIRKQLFPQKQLRFAGYTCWRGLLDQSPEHFTQTYSETWGPKGRFGMIPLSNNRLYWYALKNGQPNDSRHKTWKTDDLLLNFQDYHDPIPEIIKKTFDQHITRRDIYDLDPLFQFMYDHILLLGDAAHAATPNLGQGACLAIEDAVYLAQCMKQELSLQPAMKRFEQQRLIRTKKIIQESWLFGKMAQIDIPIICGMRNLILKWIPESFHQNRLETLQNIGT